MHVATSVNIMWQENTRTRLHMDMATCKLAAITSKRKEGHTALEAIIVWVGRINPILSCIPCAVYFITSHSSRRLIRSLIFAFAGTMDRQQWTNALSAEWLEYTFAIQLMRRKWETSDAIFTFQSARLCVACTGNHTFRKLNLCHREFHQVTFS